MGKEQIAEREAAIALASDAIVAVIHAIQADPDEEFASHLIGPAAAHAAICALEHAGYTIERRPR